MSNSNYRRVSRKRICRICGKPDWCSYSPDEKISFCARTTDGADKVSREDWGIYFHDKNSASATPVICPPKITDKPKQPAPLQIRNFVYQKLIELAPAAACDRTSNGSKGLRERKIFDFERYGSLPRLKAERQGLAKQIRALLNQNFPEYVRANGGSFAGLPGFWLDKCGRAQIWFDRDYFAPMLLVPYRAANDSIQACQIRFMCDFVSDARRYVWLSTPEQNRVTCGTPLHFARGFDQDEIRDDATILVTEGALKADTIRVFKPDVQVVAVSGVSCAHREIVETARAKQLLIGFDADYHENPQVVRQLARLVRTRLEDAREFGYHSAVKILAWNRAFKGLDDALLNRQTITAITIYKWLASLSADCRRIALKVFKFDEPLVNSYLKSEQLCFANLTR